MRWLGGVAGCGGWVGSPRTMSSVELEFMSSVELELDRGALRPVDMFEPIMPKPIDGIGVAIARGHTNQRTARSISSG